MKNGIPLYLALNNLNRERFPVVKQKRPIKGERKAKMAYTLRDLLTGLVLPNGVKIIDHLTKSAGVAETANIISANKIGGCQHGHESIFHAEGRAGILEMCRPHDAQLREIVRHGQHRPAAFVHTNGSIQHAPYPVYFSTEQRLIARVLQSKPWDDDKHPERESREELYRMLVRVELLIIDDVGKVQHRDPAFTQEMYYRIIDDRYTQDRPVIITTNLSLDDLETHIGGACADRLREMCGLKGMMTMKGTSYRRVK